MSQLTTTAILAIVKGVPKVPSDSVSAEQGLDSIPLTDPNGFSVTDYEPQIPSLKSNAVWADSSQSNGRRLISGTLGNVQEVIRLELTAGTIVQMAAMLSRLGRVRQDCNDFWDTYYQTEPVWLKHQVVGEPGPRYALLYNIDINIDSQTDPSVSNRTVTLHVEREEGWRGLSPGDNPKHWTRIFTNTETRWNTTTVDLLSVNDHLISNKQIYNAVEWLDKSTIRKANYIDIPASSIPGDLPALTTIVYDPPGGLYTLILSKSTKPTSVTLRDGSTARQFYDLAAAHIVPAYLGTDTSLETDAGGVLYSPLSGNIRRAKVTFATDATNVTRLTWTSAPTGSAATPPPIDENMFRGTFMAFCRCRQVGGAAGDVHMSLQYGTMQNVGDVLIETTEVVPTIQAGTGDTTDWPVTYMGVITIPVMNRAQVSPDGRGMGAVSDHASNDFRIQLFARAASATPDLYICDLILIPIDEQAVVINVPAGTSTNVVLDNTGYFMRGVPDPYAARINYATGTTASSPKMLELRGSGITLDPGKNNRIYVFLMDGTNLSDARPANLSAMYIDIVPRWQMFRDV